MAKKVIIVGAASGIGEALAKIMSHNGYELGLADVNQEGVDALASKFKSITQYLDLVDVKEARESFEKLLNNMGAVDIIILNAGIRFEDPDLDWDKQKKMIDVNVVGFTELATQAMHYLLKQGHGQLVGTSSIAGT